MLKLKNSPKSIDFIYSTKKKEEWLERKIQSDRLVPAHCKIVASDRELTPDDILFLQQILEKQSLRLTHLHFVHHSTRVGLHEIVSNGFNSILSVLFSDKEKDISHQMLGALYLLIVSQKNIVKLTLANNNFSEKEMDLLFVALKDHVDLKELDVSYNVLSKASIIKLVEQVKKKAIKRLALAYCNLDIALLCQQLEGYTHLRELNLQGNPFTALDAISLINFLENTPLLARVDLSEDQKDALQLMSGEGEEGLYRKWDKQLRINSYNVQQWHQALLSEPARRKETLIALEDNQQECFDLFLGLDCVPDEHKLRLHQKETWFFEKRMQALARCAFVTALKDCFQSPKEEGAKNNAIINITQGELSLINIEEIKRVLTQTKQERVNVLKEQLEMLTYYYFEGELVALDEQLTEEKRGKLSHNLVLRLIDTNYEEILTLMQQIEPDSKKIVEKLAQLQVESEQLWEKYTAEANQLHVQEIEYQKQCDNFHNRWNLLHKKGQLPTVYLHEAEELAKSFLQQNINLNMPTGEKGETLLYAACRQNKVWAVSLLLAKGANVLAKNADGTCVLYYVISTIQQENDCHAIILNYIKQSLEVLWPNEYQKELPEVTQRLQQLKTHLDEYLMHLLEVQKHSKIMRFLKGEWHEEERKKEWLQYYNALQEANKHEDLLKVLVNTIEVAEKARRGLLQRSQLHDGVMTISLNLKEIVETNLVEYKKLITSITVYYKQQVAELQNQLERKTEENSNLKRTNLNLEKEKLDLEGEVLSLQQIVKDKEQEKDDLAQKNKKLEEEVEAMKKKLDLLININQVLQLSSPNDIGKPGPSMVAAEGASSFVSKKRPG